MLKLLGDILWTTAEAFPEVMLQEQAELEREYMTDVTEDNVDILWRRLTEVSTSDSGKNACFYEIHDRAEQEREVVPLSARW